MDRDYCPLRGGECRPQVCVFYRDGSGCLAVLAAEALIAKAALQPQQQLTLATATAEQPHYRKRRPGRPRKGGGDDE